MCISAVLATHLDVLRDQCRGAADVVVDTMPQHAAQFKSIIKGLSGTSAMLVAAVKTFVSSPSDANRAQCMLFAEPVQGVVDVLLRFVGSVPQFVGNPPQVKRDVADYIKPIQAGAMAAVSAANLFVTSVRAYLANPADATARADISRYATAVNTSLAELTNATKEARDAKIMHEV